MIPFFFSGTNHKVDQRVERLFALLSFFLFLQSPEQLFVYIIIFKRNDLTCEHWNYGQRKGRKMFRGNACRGLNLKPVIFRVHSDEALSKTNLKLSPCLCLSDRVSGYHGRYLRACRQHIRLLEGAKSFHTSSRTRWLHRQF